MVTSTGSGVSVCGGGSGLTATCGAGATMVGAMASATGAVLGRRCSSHPTATNSNPASKKEVFVLIRSDQPFRIGFQLAIHYAVFDVGKVRMSAWKIKSPGS